MDSALQDIAVLTEGSRDGSTSYNKVDRFSQFLMEQIKSTKKTQKKVSSP